MKKLLLFFLILLTCDVSLHAQEVQKLRIDPAQAYGGFVSDYFQEVHYIPLQTTKQSLFGSIGSIIITDSSYVITDNDTKAVLFFRKDGIFITKVKFKDDEYPYASYESNTKRILISYYSNRSQNNNIQYYNLVGTKQDVNIKIKSNERKQEMYSLGEGYFINTLGCYLPPGEKPADSVFFAIQIYKGDSLYKTFMPMIEAQIPGLCALGFHPFISASGKDSAVYVTTRFFNDIYRVTKDTIQKVYTVVFPFNRMLDKDLLESKDLKQIDSLRDNIYKSQNIISGISNLYFQNDLMLFKIDQTSYIHTQGTDELRQNNLIYNLKTGRLISLERITPDEKSSYLPLMGGFYMSMRGLTYHDGYFYSNVPSLQMFTAREATKDKKPQYPPVLEKYFKTESRKSNPVIVQLKLKNL